MGQALTALKMHLVRLRKLIPEPRHELDECGDVAHRQAPVATGRLGQPARDDGWADIAFDADGNPYAVWAYDNGVEHDVAFAEWTGARWKPPVFLASGPEDELDTRVFVQPDGTVHVVW